jgi:excinuclease UvrABC ATPase subunit
VIDPEKSIAEGAVLHSDFKKGGWYWKKLLKCGYYDPHKPVKDFTPQEMHDLLYKESTKFTNVHQGEEYESTYEGVITELKRRYINQEEASDAYTQFFTYQECRECHGSRINAAARSVKVNGVSIDELVFLEMHDFRKFLGGVRGDVAKPLVAKMMSGVQNLIDIGVGYLSLHRQVATLSGGESQRVKMAKQLDCNLVNLMYVLDEPSIGLHPRDISHLKRMIHELRDKGNTMLVVEHDPDIIRFADHVIDIGPEAGTGGGHICFSGNVKELLESNTITSRYLNISRKESKPRRSPKAYFEIRNASIHNLRNLNVKIPAGVFVCVTGVAGSGKSSLVHYEFCRQHPEAILIDQSAVGRSSRSNPMTYVGIFDMVRKEFAGATGKNPSLFSFNSSGACPKCKGLGVIKVELSFLDDVTMTCDECNGKRYLPEVLDLRYKGKSIYDVLQMTIREAIGFFEDPAIMRKLQILQNLGLDYLELGQALSTLSGGEAQRIKLASELHRKGNIYIMDEPTTGLHMADTDRLLDIINHLVDKGNSVIVIEHNLDVVREADWVIDLGPEGGSMGGQLVAEGTPEQIALVKGSYTGQYLRRY